MKNNDGDEEEKGITARLKSYMSVLFAEQTIENVSKKILEIKDSKPFTTLTKVISSKAFSRGIGLITVVAGATGLLVVAPAVLVTLAAGMGAAIAVDAYMLDKTKALYQEAKLLRDNKVALDKQNMILGKDALEKTPLQERLNSALRDKLLVPSKNGNSKQQQAQLHEKKAASFLGGVGAYLLDAIGGISKAVISGNPVIMVVTLASTINGVKSEGEKKHSLSEARANLKNYIEIEQKKDDAPGYDDKQSLKDQVNKQRIQAMALEKLSKIEGIEKKGDEDIAQEFNNIQKQIADRANAIQKGRSGIFKKPVVAHVWDKEILENKIKGDKKEHYAAVKHGKKILKNVINVHNPYNKYIDPIKLQEKMTTKEIVSNPEELKQLAQHFKHNKATLPPGNGHKHSKIHKPHKGKNGPEIIK